MNDGSEGDAGKGREGDGEIADRRQAPRKRTLRKGQVFYLDSGAAVECVVLDVSDSGARLRPVDILSCPDRFRLRLPDQSSRQCEVVWRDEQDIGVRFV